jgi:hypothetical protein
MLASNYDETEEVKNQKKKETSSAASSTLSLHIQAYENSIENSSDPLGEDKTLEKKRKKVDLIKKWKNAKQQHFTGSASSSLQVILEIIIHEKFFFRIHLNFQDNKKMI